MYSKKSGRVTFRSNRRQSYKKHSHFGNGKIISSRKPQLNRITDFNINSINFNQDDLGKKL